MSFFGRMGITKGDDRHSDGKFKLGPANAQRKQGDSAFQAAHDHIDNAASSAKGGDEEAATFHIGMAQQYATLGCKNHMMGDFHDKTKAPMKKEEVAAELERLAKTVAKWEADRKGEG